jgi:hypothetical protein
VSRVSSWKPCTNRADVVSRSSFVIVLSKRLLLPRRRGRGTIRAAGEPCSERIHNAARRPPGPRLCQGPSGPGCAAGTPCGSPHGGRFPGHPPYGPIQPRRCRRR